jgi:hypothetical protein
VRRRRSVSWLSDLRQFVAWVWNAWTAVTCVLKSHSSYHDNVFAVPRVRVVLSRQGAPWPGRLTANPSSRRLGSIPGHSMTDLWWAKWHWDRFCVPLSVSFHGSHTSRCSPSQTRNASTHHAMKCVTAYITYMEHSSSSQSNSRLANQEIPDLVWTSEAQCRIHKTHKPESN